VQSQNTRTVQFRRDY